MAIAIEFGLVSGLGAIGAGLLSVRGTDRDVKGAVGLAQGGGKNIRRPQVSARDEHSAWPHPPRSRSLGLRPCPGIPSGRQHKARVRMAQRSPGAGGPSRRTPRAPSLYPGAGSSATSTCDRPRHHQVPAVARGRPRSPPAHASEASLNARSCPRRW